MATAKKSAAGARKPATKAPAKSAAKSASKGAAKKGAAKAPAMKKAAAKAPAMKKAAATKAPAAKKAASGAAKGGAAKGGATKRAPNPAFMRPMTPSPQLAAVIGSTPVPRSEVAKKLWQYIKANNLQDQANKRQINADDNLRPIFGKPSVSMFDMTKLVSKHLS